MKGKKYIVFIALTIGFVFSLSGASTLFAQESVDDEFTLEEITVTAQKRAENLQKVAIAMEVVSGDEIRELGKNDIDEILQGMSNTIIEKAQDGYRVTIRGVTDNSEAYKGQSMAPPAVAINLDGVYSNKKDTGSGLFDVERVEVLYGPQSTMYSSNSPGGIVNVVTANPKTDRYEGSGSLEYGNFNLLHTEGAMNAPLNDKMAIRASFSTSKRDAYLSTGNDDEDTKSARLRALIQPNDKLSFVFTGETTRNSSAGFGGGVQTFDTQDGHWYQQTKVGRQGSYVDLGPVTDPWIGVTNDKVNNSNQVTKKIYGQFTFNLGVGTLTMTPNYSKRRGTSQMEWAPPGSTNTETSYMKQSVEEKGLEVRMASAADSPIKWIVGLTYYNSFDRNIDTSQAYLDSGPETVAITEDPTRPRYLNGVLADQGTLFPHWGRMSDRQMTNKNKAFFANITYPFTDAFRGTAGYRQSWDQFITDNYEIKGQPGSPDLAYAYEPFLMENAGKPDYKVGVEYDVAENSMLYADYATSYRIQGMGGGPPGTKSTVEPERLKSYTVGAKNRFFNNKLQLNAAAYYYDYKNYRAGGNDTEVWLNDFGDARSNPPIPAGNLVQDMAESGRDGNANGTGAGRVIGLDLSANWLITQSDRVNITASYIKSEWTDLYIDYEYDQTGTIINGQFVMVDVPDDDFSGKPMMSTPPWNINMTYDHSFNLPNGANIKAALTVKYKTAFRLSWRPADSKINQQEAYHMEDVNVVYNSSDGKWNLSAYVKNLENYAEKRSLMNMAGDKLMSIGNPRTYGGVLSVKF
jgi:iron complex outermembrane recepter protein